MTMHFWIEMDYSRCHVYVFNLMSVIGFKCLFTLFSDVRMLRSEVTILYYFNICNFHWWDYKKIHLLNPDCTAENFSQDANKNK